MSYKVNQRDVEYNLFDYLKIQELGKAGRFQGLSREDMKAILRESLKFAQVELAPLNKIGDENPVRMDGERVITPHGYREAYQKFAANGFLAMDVPSTYGGANLPLSVTMACGEFFMGACLSFMMYPGLSRGAAHLIETFSETSTVQRFVPNMYSGKWAGTMCLTEPQAGSAVGDITTRAVLEGNTYKIVGQKIFISSGDHDLTENIIHLVLARVEGDSPGTKGISLFLVPKIWVKEDGSLGEFNDVKTVNVEKKLGLKGSSTCTLTFGDQQKCRGYLIGKQSKGMSMMFKLMNEARIAVGMQGQALAAAAYECTLQYSFERTQGGDRLIVEYPDVRRMLITQKAYTEGMRALLLYTAYQQDVAQTVPEETPRSRAQNRIDFLVPVCKAYCSDMGFKVTELALQTYGGYGYICDYPIEQYLRDSKIASIYEGTNGIQALDLIGRKLAVNQGQLFREFYEDLDRFCGDNKQRDDLETEVVALKKAADELGRVTMKFGEWALEQNYVLPQLHAMSYLYNLGDVMLSWLLLDHAFLAVALLKNNPDAAENKFLEAKLHTARFFIHHILPMAQARTQTMLGGDDSPLKISF
jgi:hypothetical protein